MSSFQPLAQFSCATCAVDGSYLCAGLGDAERGALRTIATSCVFPAKKTLFREAEQNTFLFIVTAGVISLSKLLADGRRLITELRFPGDFIGLPVAAHYAYTAETLTETRACRIERSKLFKLMTRVPRLEHQLLDLASREIAQAQDRFVLLGRKTPTERLASLFLQLADRIGQRDAAGRHMFELPMDREDLADYVGRKRETVIRALTQLRIDGVIETPSPRSIVIPDLEKLKAMTGNGSETEGAADTAIPSDRRHRLPP